MAFFHYTLTSKKCICYSLVCPYGNYHLKHAMGKHILRVQYCYPHRVYSDIHIYDCKTKGSPELSFAILVHVLLPDSCNCKCRVALYCNN